MTSACPLVSRISIHALREEGDLTRFFKRDSTKAFLSTPSARRATCTSAPTSSADGNFYPRPPRGGRLIVRAYVVF